MTKLIIEKDGKKFISETIYFNKYSRLLLSNMILKYSIIEESSISHTSTGYVVELYVPFDIYNAFMDEYNDAKIKIFNKINKQERFKNRVELRARRIKMKRFKRVFFKTLLVMLLFALGFCLPFYFIPF